MAIAATDIQNFQAIINLKPLMDILLFGLAILKKFIKNSKIALGRT
jgi:hypothetical protein